MTKEGAKAVKKFEKNYKRNWVKPYNSAGQEFNGKLKTINEKYNDGLMSDGEYTKKGRAYVKEVSDTWKSIYTQHLVNYFGEDPINKGTEWTKNALHMYDFDEMLKK